MTDTSNINYPIYRKYKNNKSYFKIISKEEFEEIQVLSNAYTLHHFKAKILPDRNLIEDLSINYEAYCDVISENEYETIKEKV
ncbi:MAG: hypothetical protein OQJ96_02450 [Flavobacteriales bacterium]|nr:hypothetical protein [Flavobacteriales bacterium]MCW8912784.1 hypothetical protein [Flavobacteriales bacterium]MCW8938788.1 hypothetical protein [Flavobacteriales bacterium]MCW8941289.1 hypothetical protein [Flavobacteriales bacterium]MCW8968498.1 hypothetical protein [Flavobacteriales bacterium]